MSETPPEQVETASDENEQGQPPEGTPTPPADPWADPEKARREIEKLRKEAATYRTKAKDLEPLAAKARELEDAQKTESERLSGQLAEAQAKTEALRSRAVRAEVRALAAEKFADPEDAAAFLDLAAFVDEDGEVDTKAITAGLADLLKRKPHLGKAETGPRRPAPDASQGSSGNAQRTTNDGDVFAGFLNQRLGR